MKAKYTYEISLRTLYRWSKKLNETCWDLKDNPKIPKTINTKVTPEIEKKVLEIRAKTGWGQERIQDYIDVSHWSVNKILNKHNLTSPSKRKKKKNKYVRFEREHPNTMWQIDHSDQKIKDKWLISIINDCSRYSIGSLAVNRVTTKVATKILDDLIKIHGKPKQILSDNGSEYGLKSKHFKFGRWCRRRGIKHIRTAIHSPTTTGKIERFFQTLSKELKFCKDLEDFRMRYNHFRPHISLGNKCPADIYFRG